MPDQYVIFKRRDGWAVAVNGSTLLICERKKAALCAVRDATARGQTLAAHAHHAVEPIRPSQGAKQPISVAL
jgi:hypothetical protein